MEIDTVFEIDARRINREAALEIRVEDLREISIIYFLLGRGNVTVRILRCSDIPIAMNEIRFSKTFSFATLCKK